MERGGKRKLSFGIQSRLVRAESGRLHLHTHEARKSTPGSKFDRTSEPPADEDNASFLQRITRGRRMSSATRTLMPASGLRPRTKVAAQLLVKRLRGGRLGLRARTFLLLEEPSSAPSAQILAVALRVLTLLSVAVAALGSVEWLTERTGTEPWLLLGLACNGLFVLEAAARISCYMPGPRNSLLDPFVWLVRLLCMPRPPSSARGQHACQDGCPVCRVRASAGEAHVALDSTRALPFATQDALTVAPFLVSLATYVRLGDLAATARWQRVFEAFAHFRLLKLCRYHESAAVLARALSRSAQALFVPLFLLFVVVTSCSTVLFELERDETIYACQALWRAVPGVTQIFLRGHPHGVQWQCDELQASGACALSGGRLIATSSSAEPLCATCGGYPSGHPECLGVPFEQTFVSVPHAMYFLVVAVTTVGFGDITPTCAVRPATPIPDRPPHSHPDPAPTATPAPHHRRPSPPDPAS